MRHHKSPEHEDSPFTGAFGTQMTDAFAKNASMFGRGFATMQKESLRFAQQRLEDNMKAIEEFGACKGWPDILAAQQRWFTGMTRAYSEEWQRCGELMNDMLHATEEDLREKEQEQKTFHAPSSRAAE